MYNLQYAYTYTYDCMCKLRMLAIYIFQLIFYGYICIQVKLCLCVQVSVCLQIQATLRLEWHKKSYTMLIWIIYIDLLMSGFEGILLSWCYSGNHTHSKSTLWEHSMHYASHNMIFLTKYQWYGSPTLVLMREKGRDLTQSYDKSPYTNRNVKRAKWQHKQRHKKVRLNSGCGPT